MIQANAIRPGISSVAPAQKSFVASMTAWPSTRPENRCRRIDCRHKLGPAVLRHVLTVGLRNGGADRHGHDAQEVLQTRRARHLLRRQVRHEQHEDSRLSPDLLAMS